MPTPGEANFDIDSLTGAEITGWPVVEASLGRLILTTFGQRRIREHVGSIVPAMLGRTVTQDTVLELLVALAMTIDVYEPRFKITQFLPVQMTRTGRITIRIEGDYVPGALRGDESVRIPMIFETTQK